MNAPADASEYLVAVAKDWTRARVAAARSSRFVLAAYRFEMSEDGFRRVALRPGSAEARCPVDAVASVATPTVWSHSTVVTSAHRLTL